MIIRVVQICSEVIKKDEIYVATDSKKISNVVEKYGYKTILTSEDCLTGTDRVAEASLKLEADIILNVQGDEPLLNPNDISKVIDKKKKNMDRVICGYSKISEFEDPNDVNIPKIIFNDSEKLIYAFSKKQLKKFYELKKKSTLEEVEDIEILRFFETDIEVMMCKLNEGSLAVDVPEDVAKIEKALSKIS